MSTRLPEPLRVVVEQLGRLPGLGPRSALRIGMRLLQWPESETRRLGNAIAVLRDELCLCSRCGGIAAEDPCPICADANRDVQTLCIVPEWDSILALESGNFYEGQYFVLGGLLAPAQKQDSGSLAIKPLTDRLREGEIREVIMALGSTLEAENTATYLKQLLNRQFPQITVTRLAQGMPLGAEVKYMDQETLRQSMRNRQQMG